MEHGKLIDRSWWPSGPWDGEPDGLEFRSHGFPCLIQRNSRFGNLCGYVGVPPGHPWWRAGGDPDDLATAHGGITYVGSGVICHAPEPGENCAGCLPAEGDYGDGPPPLALGRHVEGCNGTARTEDVLWFGFDCAHSGDLIPSSGYRPSPGDEYRTIDYVQRECERLAAQAKAAA